MVSCAAAGPKDANGPDYRIAVETDVDHEPCDTSGPGTEGLDTDENGRAEIVVVRSNGREVCRSVDLNLDGRVDMWVYRGEDGAIRRREADFDRDGRVDEIALFAGGNLAEVKRATTLRGKLDTWHVYTAGSLVATRRDADGDGYLDQWWEYPRPEQLQCPLIHSDVDGDGRPDPGATVELCKDSAPAEGEQQAAPRSAPSPVPAPTPTRVEDGIGP